MASGDHRWACKCSTWNTERPACRRPSKLCCRELILPAQDVIWKKSIGIAIQTKLTTAALSEQVIHSSHCKECQAVGAVPRWLTAWPRENHNTTDTTPKLCKKQRHSRNQSAASISENLLYMTSHSCEENLMGTLQKTGTDMLGQHTSVNVWHKDRSNLKCNEDATPCQCFYCVSRQTRSLFN